MDKRRKAREKAWSKYYLYSSRALKEDEKHAYRVTFGGEEYYALSNAVTVVLLRENPNYVMELENGACKWWSQYLERIIAGLPEVSWGAVDTIDINYLFLRARERGYRFLSKSLQNETKRSQKYLVEYNGFLYNLMVLEYVYKMLADGDRPRITSYVTSQTTLFSDGEKPEMLVIETSAGIGAICYVNVLKSLERDLVKINLSDYVISEGVAR